MKKFLSILFIFILLFPFSVNAEVPSPDVKALIHIEPAIEFEYVDLYDINVEDGALVAFSESNILKADWHEYDDFSLDEMLLLHLIHEYGSIEFTFPFIYTENTEVYALIVDEENYNYLIPGIITEDGNVIFDFSRLETGDCIMLVISTNKSEEE